jgi:hypothetical protein
MDGRKIEDWEQLRSDCVYERAQYPPTNSNTMLIILLLFVIFTITSFLPLYRINHKTYDDGH